MNVGGGILATFYCALFSAAAGWFAGSLELVRELLAGLTQAQATLVVGLFVGALSQGGVWLRWYIERRRAKR